MNATLIYCPDCLEKLQKLGEFPTSVFEFVCEYFATHDGSFVYYNTDFCIKVSSLSFIEIVDLTQDRFAKFVQVLEENGFVVTTESLDDTKIAVKPSDFATDADEWYFCCDKQHGFYDIMGFYEV